MTTDDHDQKSALDHASWHLHRGTQLAEQFGVDSGATRDLRKLRLRHAETHAQLASAWAAVALVLPVVPAATGLPADVRSNIEALLEYNWQHEKRDFGETADEMDDPSHHIFFQMARIAEWLEENP